MKVLLRLRSTRSAQSAGTTRTGAARSPTVACLRSLKLAKLKELSPRHCGSISLTAGVLFGLEAVNNRPDEGGRDEGMLRRRESFAPASSSASVPEDFATILGRDSPPEDAGPVSWPVVLLPGWAMLGECGSRKQHPVRTDQERFGCLPEG